LEERRRLEEIMKFKEIEKSEEISTYRFPLKLCLYGKLRLKKLGFKLIFFRKSLFFNKQICIYKNINFALEFLISEQFIDKILIRYKLKSMNTSVFLLSNGKVKSKEAIDFFENFIFPNYELKNGKWVRRKNVSTP